MPDDATGSPPTFTTLEADKVVKVALALKRHDEISTGGRLSLAQLEAIGAEVGLSSDNVREAIAVLGGPGNPTSFMGAPLAIRMEREIDASVSRDDDPRLIEILRRRTGFQGAVERAGSVLTWTNQEGATLLRLTVTSHQGQTHLAVEQQHAAYATGLFLAVVGGGDLAGTVTVLEAVRNGLAPALGALLVGVVVVGTWLLARRLLYARVRRDASTLNDILREVSAAIAP